MPRWSTGSDDEAVAATGKVALNTAVAGGGWLTVIVCWRRAAGAARRVDLGAAVLEPSGRR